MAIYPPFSKHKSDNKSQLSCLCISVRVSRAREIVGSANCLIGDSNRFGASRPTPSPALMGASCMQWPSRVRHRYPLFFVPDQSFLMQFVALKTVQF